MILDILENLHCYAGLPYLEKLAAYLKTADLNALPDGRTDIDGDNLYVLIQHPQEKKENLRPEAHNRYADLQLVLSGSEIMGYADRSRLGEPAEGSEEKDIFFYPGTKVDFVTVDAGMFAVFLPGDVHAPCIQNGDCTEVKKAVFKIKL